MAVFARGVAVLSLAVVVLFCNNGVRSQDPPSPCRGSQLRSGECLQAVKYLMQDVDRFWFGTNYSVRCSSPYAFADPACVNQMPGFLTLITRLRGSNSDASVDSIGQVLNVTFDVPAGSYQSCGQTYREEAVTLTVDPLRRSPLPLWSANHLPEVTWEAGGGPGQLYTLIVWDGGSIFLHGLMFNIVGNNLRGTMQTAYSYRGPKNSQDRDQPYVFLLYKQTAALDETVVTNTLISALAGNRTFYPQEIVPSLNLTGPVGVSVLTVVTDPFSTEFMKQNRITNGCPAALTPKFSALPLSYNVSQVRLVTSVDVTFTSPEISVSSCCQNAHYASNTRVPNPLGDGTIYPVYTRSAPMVTLVPPTFFDAFYFFRLKFTLLLVDITDDISPTTAGAPSTGPRPILHWQVTNIMEGDVTSGHTGLAYRAPMPLTGRGTGPWTDDRVMMFLLLRQASVLPPGGNLCSGSDPLRCRFDLAAYIADHQMSIEGASWFVTSPDTYSRSEAIRQGLQNAGIACVGVSQYQDPCPVCSSRAAWGTQAGMALMVVSAVGQLIVGHRFLLYH